MSDGTRSIADELFLLAHDDVTGKPRLHPRVTGIGLAGALLAELLLPGLLGIRAGILLPFTDVTPGDSLLRQAFAPIQVERPAKPIRPWLDALAGVAANGVPERLAQAGVLVE